MLFSHSYIVKSVNSDVLVIPGYTLKKITEIPSWITESQNLFEDFLKDEFDGFAKITTFRPS